jgi:hypothetical protein
MNARNITRTDQASSCYFRTTADGGTRKALVQIDERCNLHFFWINSYEIEATAVCNVIRLGLLRWSKRRGAMLVLVRGRAGIAGSCRYACLARQG